MRYLLDTNICIYIIRKKPKIVLERLKSLEIGDVTISSITLSELEYGVSKSSQIQQNRDALNAFLAPIEVAPYDHMAAYRYGQLRAFLEQKGLIIGAMDMLIAAHALSLSVTLATNNTREFKRIPGLDIENWA
jgi:tRNA(fMet)-specific endonuclease VapC